MILWMEACIAGPCDKEAESLWLQSARTACAVAWNQSGATLDKGWRSMSWPWHSSVHSVSGVSFKRSSMLRAWSRPCSAVWQVTSWHFVTFPSRIPADFWFLRGKGLQFIENFFFSRRVVCLLRPWRHSYSSQRLLSLTLLSLFNVTFGRGQN